MVNERVAAVGVVDVVGAVAGEADEFGSGTSGVHGVQGKLPVDAVEGSVQGCYVQGHTGDTLGVVRPDFCGALVDGRKRTFSEVGGVDVFIRDGAEGRFHGMVNRGGRGWRRL